VPLTFAYAILRYRLWDIGPLVRSSVSLTLTVLLGVLGFSLANLAVTRVVPEDLAAARTLLTFASGLAIAGLMIPTRRGLDRTLERIQYRHTFQRRRSLAEFGRDLLHERDLGQLSEMLLGQLEETFDVACANLLLRSEAGLIPVRGEPALPSVVPEEALGEDFWASEVRTLSAVELAVEPMTPQRRLFAAGYRYALPLEVRDTRLGAVVLGFKAGEVPLASDDLDLIRNLLDQVALAVDNAQLLEQVRAQLAEVTRLEHYTREIFESSPTGIVVLDRDGRIESANTAFERLVGERVEAGRLLAEVLPIEALPEPGEGLREVRFGTPGAEPRYLQLSVASFEAGPHGPRRVVVVADVTDRITMEAALQQGERLASLGMLAAGVAHEVNTPLTGISSYAQLLLADTPADDPRRALLEKVERQTFRASRIVANLLELSRERPRETRPVDLGRLVGDGLDLLAERIAGANVRLTWKLPEVPIVVEGNDGELQQVVTNLALNAVEALAPAGGDLEVTLKADERWARLAVRDSGPGIAPEELERIFEPFVSTKTAQGGTGLGLAISYAIVQRHGGDLRVVSHPGEGTCFLVELPRAAGESR
jgi:signal transduction histidine kinase